ncbi:MAG: heme-copper oxidase subunit III [Chloroflexi bacterium]|nr:MAG: heme-copper oxidase subunit III [Chloroflexota bacterium]TME18401.1 MAG: heme-copper oxidase subunit III [Chloroflexota bacterium]
MAVAALPRERAPEHPRLAPGMMGMYIFLASEIMFFGSLFATYFYLASSHTHWPPGGFTPVEPIPVPAVNTVVLLSSGVTMHISHLAIQAGNRRRFISWLVVTIVLGTGFEIGQVYEFLRAEVFRTFTANEFATAFFTMTGFHGLHVLGGLIFLVIVLARALGGQFSAQHHVGVAAGAIYWHFVDIVWVFLYGILYWVIVASTGNPVAHVFGF